MHAERERDLTAVMQIMFNEVPDYPRARDGRWLAGVLACIGLLPVGRGPTGDRFLHPLPRSLQAIDQFGRIARWHPLAVPCSQDCKLVAALTHQLIEPARPRANHVP